MISNKYAYTIFVTFLMIVFLWISSLTMLFFWKKSLLVYENNESVFEERFARLESELYVLKQKRVANITVTAYSPRTIETDSTPFTTAFMTKVANRTIGLPWYLIQQGWTPGNCVYLNIPHALYGGIYKINDRMDDRYQFRADIFFFSTEHAVEFGRFYNIDMVYLGECP